MTLRFRFQKLQSQSAFDDALASAESAVQHMPKNHPELCIAFVDLGLILNLAPQTEHRERAVDAYLSGWNCVFAPPFPRISCATLAVDLLIECRNWKEAAALAIDAIKLMPSMSSRSVRLADQQRTIGRFSGRASKACSLNLAVSGKTEGAIEVLKQARGVILGLLLDARSEYATLKSSEHASLFEEYEALHARINAPISDTEMNDERYSASSSRKEARRQLEHCLEKIRRLPGLERFQLGLTSDEIMREAVDGYIIVVNISDIRSDGFVI